MSREQSTPVLIIGAGASGAAAAWNLADVHRLGDTIVLCTVVGAKEIKEGQDFFPLTVNYQEKYSAAGRIPGGYFKREGRPTEREILISRSLETLVWMREKGVKFQASFGRQAMKVGDKFKFFGGLAAETWGGGPGLVENEHQACTRAGIPIFYETPATGLIQDDAGRVIGVKARHKNKNIEIRCKAVVLACGGFESNAEMRTRYLGAGWDLAKVRGTRFNPGAGIRMALAAGALPYGHWSGCHAVGWDLNAPPFGDLAVGDNFQKHSYPIGIMINANGERFVDEGADIRNYTYAKYGAVVLNQPGMFAWQIFDAQTIPLLRDEYRIKQVTKVKANTLEDLVKQLDGVDQEACLRELKAYNAAVRVDIPFNPAIKDGRCTEGITPKKSNWASPIEKPPYWAYSITGGVTFTFGGLQINTQAQVLNTSNNPIRGLFASGDIVNAQVWYRDPGAPAT